MTDQPTGQTPADAPEGEQDRYSPLHDEHVALGAALTSFGGWQMPLRYSSDLAEHRAVRAAAGLFDLSHMGEIEVAGPQAAAALDHALVGDLTAVAPGRARYTMICAEDGSVLDDLVVYRLDDESFLVVANAGNAPLVAHELVARAEGFDAVVTDRGSETALVAVQGPRAEEIVAGLVDTDAAGAEGQGDPVQTVRAMKYYASAPVVLTTEDGVVEALVARTGYTGEDGFELFVPADRARALWRTVLAAGAPHGLVPAGLSARDSLRLEAGMPLYGHELDTTTTPYEAGLGRVVKLDKTAPDGTPLPFVGRAALAARKVSPPARVLVGLKGLGRRPARAGYGVVLPAAGGEPRRVGTVTSGAPSPTLGHPIALAYVSPELAAEGTELAVDVRGRAEPVVVVPLPFYRRPQQS
ncbi:glycine cleavage system aminomethyltransferase GcvT [Cellulosimicrobium sp. Marseille-Q8652]